MENLIHHIFSESSFVESDHNGRVHFYEKTNEDKLEFFLVDFILENDILNYFEVALNSESSVSEINQTPLIGDVHFLFNEQVKKRKEIEKNTSLIVCIKMMDFATGFQKIKNQVLLIEEHEYWFKKYVVLYTDESVPKNLIDQSYLTHITELVSNSSSFGTMKNNMFLNGAYFLALQLFIKIPFLNAPKGQQQAFVSPDQLIEMELTASDLSAVKNILCDTDLDDEQWWERFGADCISINTDEQRIDALLSKFEAHD
ncbi:hypothetical protein SAMN05216436_1353 [bacterium A37T11]|nr:hypothetical protein SAMN05216436_1353 [bacterium A37T11]